MKKAQSKQSKGGQARAKALSPARRSSIARKAARARWGKQAMGFKVGQVWEKNGERRIITRIPEIAWKVVYTSSKSGALQRWSRMELFESWARRARLVKEES